jgi:hypothetical protein
VGEGRRALLGREGGGHRHDAGDHVSVVVDRFYLARACARAREEGAAPLSAASAAWNVARKRPDRREGWRVYRVLLPDEDEEPELLTYCAACAVREFGSAGSASRRYG